MQPKDVSTLSYFLGYLSALDHPLANMTLEGVPSLAYPKSYIEHILVLLNDLLGNHAEPEATCTTG